MSFRKEVLHRCAEDTLYWFDNFAWTLDPRRDPSKLCFIPYSGKQIAFIEWLEDLIKNPRDGFVDKPRDVGATTIVTNLLLKHWLFDDYFNARIGSRKEDYVDKTGDPDTLFYKIDYTFQLLPHWMRPDGWLPRVNRSHMRLSRPDNSNTITGESANPNFGRGGRQTIVVFDEIGFWSYAKPAWESAGDVTKIRLAMTTPPDTGRSSFAYKLLTNQAGKVEKFEFVHTDIPTKDAQWLKEERERRSEDEFNREILKSYTGSTRNKVYAEDWHAHVKVGQYDYDPNLPLYTSWDFGFNDPTSIIWAQKNHKTNEVFIIDSFEKNNKTIDFFIPFITGVVPSGIHEYTDYELDKIQMHGAWRKDQTHFGDPSGGNRNQVTGTSIRQVLREAGIYVQSKPAKKHKFYREKVLLLLRRLHVDQSRCDDFIDMILSARYPERTESSQATSAIDKPIHDESSHFRTALEFFADNEPVVKKTTSKNLPKYSYKPKGGYL